MLQIEIYHVCNEHFKEKYDYSPMATAGSMILCIHVLSQPVFSPFDYHGAIGLPYYNRLTNFPTRKTVLYF